MAKIQLTFVARRKRHHCQELQRSLVDRHSVPDVFSAHTIPLDEVEEHADGQAPLAPVNARAAGPAEDQPDSGVPL